MKKFVFFILCLFSISVYSQQYSQKWTDVNYVGDGQVYHNLDIYLPQTVKTSYPVVIYIYGSAWQSNNSKTSDMSTVGAALLTAGYAVVSINHRSSSDAKWPAQINDVKAAIRFVRATATQYKFDTCFIAMCGSSSGGHLSGIAGLTRNVKVFNLGSTSMNIEGTLGPYTSCSSSVDAVCDWFGPKYLAKMDSCGNTTSHTADNSPGSMILGCAIKQCPNNAALLEHKTYIDSSDPPFLIFHGTADNVVPYCASVFLNKDLKALGVQSEYVEVPGGGHYSNVHTTTNYAKMVTFFNGVRDEKCSGVISNITVSLTSPANNATFEAPATILITANASTTSGSISKVEFFNGSSKIGEDLSSPYTYSWTNVQAGTYTITAVATDNSNSKKTSSAITVVVTVPQGPYNGTIHSIPGKIEFEHYDVGGNGAAYLDNTSDNTGGADFRMDEDVDIESCTDAGVGYNIGYATAGEWLEYTVNVASAGLYDINFRVACNGTGRTILLSAGGTVIVNNASIPNTGAWQTWTDLSVKNVSLQAGIQILRLTIGSQDYVNLNYMNFTAVVADNCPNDPNKTEPGICGCGVPDTDTDNDGTPDCNDLCPNDINKTDPGTCGCGIPEGSCTQIINLLRGWNMISFYILPTDLSIDNVFASIMSNVEIIKNEKAFYKHGSAFNSLKKIASNGAYLVKMSANATLTLNGTVSNFSTTQLKKGWNLVGLPFNKTVDLQVFINSLSCDVSVIKNFDDFYDKDNNQGELQNLQYGKAYYIYVDSPCTINWNSL